MGHREFCEYCGIYHNTSSRIGKRHLSAQRARGGASVSSLPPATATGHPTLPSAPAAPSIVKENPAYRGDPGIYVEKELPQVGAYAVGAGTPPPVALTGGEPGVPSAGMMKKEVPLVAANSPRRANILLCPTDEIALVFYGMGNSKKERGVMVYKCPKCERFFRKKR